MRVVLAVTEWRWVRRLVTGTRIGRRVALRFVAGETLDEAIAVAHKLNAMGASVSLDHLGEHVTDRLLAEKARDDYLACLDRISAETLDANISVKLSQLGLGFNEELCSESLDLLAGAAANHGSTITIDMEESEHTATTVRLYLAAQHRHGNLGIAVQAYLRRTPEDLMAVIGAGGHVRLCKGAYDEAEEIAFTTRAEIDAAFDKLAFTLMNEPSVAPAIATHDSDRIEAAVAAAESRTEDWEFQMLYGVRENLQQRLIADRRRLRIYVPYGDSWYPYLTRRLGERPANLWFFVRALFGR